MYIFVNFLSPQDDWDDNDNYGNQDSREKSRSRGPPRMRRGGSQAAPGQRNNNNAPYREQGGYERDEFNGSQPRGAGQRRGDPSSRRGAPAGGGVSRGGGRAFQSRAPKPEAQSGPSVGAFSGSIDTWNNPPSISGGGGGGTAVATERGGSSVGSSSGTASLIFLGNTGITGGQIFWDQAI